MYLFFSAYHSITNESKEIMWNWYIRGLALSRFFNSMIQAEQHATNVSHQYIEVNWSIYSKPFCDFLIKLDINLMEIINDIAASIVWRRIVYDNKSTLSDRHFQHCDTTTFSIMRYTNTRTEYFLPLHYTAFFKTHTYTHIPISTWTILFSV